MRDLSRLLHPRRVAVIGGGAWGAAVAGAAARLGYAGWLGAVHPSGRSFGGLPVVARIGDLEAPVDCAFVAVNRDTTLDVVRALRDGGCGGAVCFASGFAEAEDGARQAALLEAAGDMPILGPNCYGFVNALDRVAVWPDQHGMAPVDSGVAIITQSSNIAINLTMQRRGLPLALIATVGNAAQIGQADLAISLLDDDRITAIGLHVEGFGDLRGWEALAQAARKKGVPLVAIKSGRSEAAQAAAVSHTASLAGSDAGAAAVLKRLGIARVASLDAFLETLKLLHHGGPLPGRRIASMSCSGGEAALVADSAEGSALTFPPLTPAQTRALSGALGPKVALANPLDYHTYIWRDVGRMTDCFAAMADPGLDLILLILDLPHTDPSDWDCALEAIVAARARTGARYAVVATLPELMPEEVIARLARGGVAALNGLDAALAAVGAAGLPAVTAEAPVLSAPALNGTPALLAEDAAKAALADHGLPVPRGEALDDPTTTTLLGPLALKRLGLAHKSEAGAVRMNLAPADLADAARRMGGGPFLVEEMVTGGVAELLIGVTRDPAHGFLLTLGAGGVLTEILQDSATLLIPASRASVAEALRSLRLWPLLGGYRGKPAADLPAILEAIAAVQSYVLANAARLDELEINPLICTPDRAVAADALVREVPDGRD